VKRSSKRITPFIRGLSNSSNGNIFKLKLGNQGTYWNASQQLVYREPRVYVSDTLSAAAADLYNPTYAEIVDEGTTGAGSNSVTYTTVAGTTSSRVIITMEISGSEAINRLSDGSSSSVIATTDTSVDSNSSADNAAGAYFFDELGLFTKASGDSTVVNVAHTDELMLSHLIFSPIEHTANRNLTLIYSITITAV
jgi:hypothetical protein